MITVSDVRTLVPSATEFTDEHIHKLIAVSTVKITLQAKVADTTDARIERACLLTAASDLLYQLIIEKNEQETYSDTTVKISVPAITALAESYAKEAATLVDNFLCPLEDYAGASGFGLAGPYGSF